MSSTPWMQSLLSKSPPFFPLQPLVLVPAVAQTHDGRDRPAGVVLTDLVEGQCGQTARNVATAACSWRQLSQLDPCAGLVAPKMGELWEISDTNPRTAGGETISPPSLGLVESRSV